MPVLLFAGEEDFLLARRVNELREELVLPAFAAFNFVRLENPPVEEIIDIAGGLPFGPSNKMILIERCELFHKKRSGQAQEPSAKKAKEAAKDLSSEFEQALASVADNTYLVFACPYNFDKTLKLSKAIEKHAKLVEFPKQKYYVGSRNPQLETWCRKEAHSFGTTISDDAIHYLLESTEANLRYVSKEIEKAATYILPNKQITLAHVQELASHTSHIFAFIDQWASNQPLLALRSLNELTARQSAMPLIATMQTTLSRWIELKIEAEKIIAKQPVSPGMARRANAISTQELAKKIAWETKSQPFLIEKDLARISGLSLEWLMEKRIKLCELENAIKTGQMPDSHALALLIAS